MFRKIVISVLLILAGVIASAGIADLAGWYLEYAWYTPERHKMLYIVGLQGSALIVTHGPVLLYDPPLLWAYPQQFGSTADRWLLSVPLWIPFIFFAAYPILVLIKTIRRRLRRKPGHCSNCGYDLTGLPEPKCPECGTEFER